MADKFYVRYYSGHTGRYGHEFLEFEYSDGRLRYANNSNYRNDSLIRKEKLRRIVSESEVIKSADSLLPLLLYGTNVPISAANREDDANWPKKNIVGKQELEVRVDNTHISFETATLGSLVDVQGSDDPEGLRVFYYLVQDLKIFVFSLISMHFKIKPTH